VHGVRATSAHLHSAMPSINSSRGRRCPQRRRDHRGDHARSRQRHLHAGPTMRLLQPAERIPSERATELRDALDESAGGGGDGGRHDLAREEAKEHVHREGAEAKACNVRGEWGGWRAGDGRLDGAAAAAVGFAWELRAASQ
jgi:hypothetical protein